MSCQDPSTGVFNVKDLMLGEKVKKSTNRRSRIFVVGSKHQGRLACRHFRSPKPGTKQLYCLSARLTDVCQLYAQVNQLFKQQHKNKTERQQNRTKNWVSKISGVLFLKILQFAEKKGLINLWILSGKSAKKISKSIENSMDLHTSS